MGSKTVAARLGCSAPGDAARGVYTGMTPWSAARELAELVQPVAGLEAYGPSQRYHVVDAHHEGEEALPEPNLMSAVVRLERMASPSDLVGVVDRLRDELRNRRGVTGRGV